MHIFVQYKDLLQMIISKTLYTKKNKLKVSIVRMLTTIFIIDSLIQFRSEKIYFLKYIIFA